MVDEIIKVLLVEDDEEDYLLTQDVLEEIPGSKYKLEWVTSFDDGVKAILKNGYDICLVDYRLGKEDGLKLLRLAAERGLDIPFIILTGHNDREVDLQAMKMGAADFLVKGNINADLLDRAIRYSIQLKKTVKRLSRSEELLSEAQEIAHIGHFNWDIQKQTIEWSDEQYRIFGLVPQSESITYERILEFIVPEDIPRMGHVVEFLLSTGEYNDIDFRIKLPCQTIKYLHGKARAERNSAGEVIRIIGITQDVTERIKAEAFNRDISKIVEDSLNEVYIFDVKSLKFIQVNRGGRENIGYSIEEMQQLTPIQIKPEYTKDSFLKIIQPLLAKEKEKITFETIHLRKDGTTYPVEIHLQYSTLGNRDVFVAIILDLTERIKAENYMEATLSSIASHIALINEEGIIMTTNKAWRNFAEENTSGQISLTGEGMNYLRICRTSLDNGDILAGQVLVGISTVLEGKQNEFYLEYPCHAPHEKRWFSMRVRPLSHAIPGAVVVHNNITPRKLAEIELQEYSDQLEQKVIVRTNELAESNTKLVEAKKIANLAYIEYDLINNTIHGSKQLYSIFDLEVEGIVSVEQFSQFIHPDDVVRVQSEIAEGIKNKAQSSLVFRILTEKGKEKYIHTQTSKIIEDPDGKTRLIRGTVQDITKLKQTELALEKALGKEQELNQLKSRFVSMASHEFRTPLTSIMSSTSLIDLYGSRENFEKQKKHVERIQSSVNNLTSILNDFLSLEKLESGKINFIPEQINLQEFVYELKEEMVLFTKENQLIHHKHTGEEEANMDKHLVKNILINLMSNAIKYSPNGEDVYLTTENSKEQVIIQVKDQGIGIPEKDQEQMFSRFFRASNAVAIQGTGLGLTIVKRYLDLMGGTISFTSKPNEGTIFEVKIPFND